MRITVRVVLIVIAVVCFALAAAGVASRVNLMAAGLACWATATLLP